MNYTAETLMVYPIDPEKMAKYVADTISLPQLDKDHYYYISPYEAFMFEPMRAISSDCCWQEAFPKMVIGNYMGFAVPIVVTIKGPKGDVEKFEMYVLFHDLKGKPLVKEPVSLKEFMGSRYNYNPRIVANQNMFLKEINQH